MLILKHRGPEWEDKSKNGKAKLAWKAGAYEYKIVETSRKRGFLVRVFVRVDRNSNERVLFHTFFAASVDKAMAYAFNHWITLNNLFIPKTISEAA